MSTETLLRIDGVALPLGSARGITQTLEPIDGELRRSINGALVDLTRATHRKYRSSIQCRDQAAPTLGGLWRGVQVVVECAVPIREAASSGSLVLQRDPVAGAVQAFAADGAEIAVSVAGRSVTLGAFAGVAEVRYRPVLTMRVVSYSMDGDEWAGAQGWTLELEEA